MFSPIKNLKIAVLCLFCLINFFVCADELNEFFSKAKTEHFDKNYKQAINWYLKAAEQGHADSQFFLGSMFYKGEGIPKDYKQAFTWYQKAAEQGHFFAQYRLGQLYEHGNGVTQDDTLAISWYRKAAEQTGDVEAQFSLAIMYARALDYNNAAIWFRRSAEQGYKGAQYWLGVQYQSGEGVTQDYSQAVHWFRKAAEQNFVHANIFLGLIYKNGAGSVTQDLSQAVKWFRKAADLGSASGQMNLGHMYFFGYGVTQDYSKAMTLYREAAAKGEADAQLKLGIMYQEGYGVEQDKPLAIAWYRKAAEQGNKTAKQILSKLYDDSSRQSDEQAFATPGKFAEHSQLDSKISPKDMPASGEGNNSFNFALGLTILIIIFILLTIKIAKQPPPKFRDNYEELEPEIFKEENSSECNSDHRIISCLECSQKIRFSLPLSAEIIKCQRCCTKLKVRIDENSHIYVTFQNKKQADHSETEPEVMSIADVFSVLGLSIDATPEEVRSAYKKKVREYHPDKVAFLGDKLKGMAEEEMKKINNAYSSLKDNGYA